MSWSDKLISITAETARQGATRLSRSEGQIGRLVRKLVPEAVNPSNGAVRERFEPGSARPDGTPWQGRVEGGVVRRAVGQGANGLATARPHPSPFASAESEANGATTQVRRPRLLLAGVTAVPDPAPGEVVADAYEVRGRLAASARFTLYLAYQPAWRSDVVLKVPTVEILRSAGAGKEIVDRAARWTALGLHPHLVYCHEACVVGGVPIPVIEHADGGSLLAWIADGRAANLRIGLNLAVQLCHALEHLHRKGLRYGPITADHVLVCGDGMLKLTNAGSAEPCTADPEAEVRVDRCAALLRADGRAAHGRAPEEWIEGAAVEARADVFALGVFLYEMLCGAPPYAETRGAARPPAPPRFAQDGGAPLDRLAALLRRSVGWQPEERPADVVEVRHELCRVYEELLDRTTPFAELPPASWEVDGWNNRALAALQAGDAAEADAAWEAALCSDPRHLDALYNHGVVRWRRGEVSDEVLVSNLERIYAAARGNWRAGHCLALVHLERDDAARALRLLEEARGVAGERDEIVFALQAARARAAEPRTAASDLAGHRAFVSAVRISHDGRSIVSASDDHTLCLWDASTGRPVRSFEGHAQRISTLDLDDEGKIAISGAEDSLLKLWDLASGRCLETIETAGAVFCASLSADATRAASSSSSGENYLGIDNTVLQVWDLGRKRLLGSLVGHTSATKTVAISADGQSVITGSDDLTVRIWDATGGVCKRVLQGHEHYVSCVLFAPDGRHALSGSWDQTIRLWDIVSGRCLRVFAGDTAIVTAIALSGDGQSMVSGSWDGTVRVWEVETGRCRRTFRAHGRMVTGVALSADGRTAVSGSWDSMVRVWSVPAPGREICALRLSVAPAYARLPSAEPEPDELVAAAARAYREGDHTTALRSLRRARQSAEADDLPDARRLWRALSLVSTRSGLRAPRAAAAVTLPGGTGLVCLGDEPAQVLAANRDGRLQLWDTELERSLRTFEGHGARVLGLVAGKERAISASADATLRLWDLERGACSQVLNGHTSIVSAVSASPDFRWALSGSYDHTARLWDLATGESVRTFTGHTRQVTAVCLAGGPRFAAAGAYDGSIRLWNTDDTSRSRVLTGHEARITHLRLSADAALLLSASADGTVRLWDPESGECARVLQLQNAAALSADLTPEAGWAVVAASDGRVRLWKLADGSAQVLLEGAAHASLSPDGCWLAVLDRAGKLHVLELDWELEHSALPENSIASENHESTKVRKHETSNLRVHDG